MQELVQEDYKGYEVKYQLGWDFDSESRKQRPDEEENCGTAAYGAGVRRHGNKVMSDIEKIHNGYAPLNH